MTNAALSLTNSTLRYRIVNFFLSPLDSHLFLFDMLNLIDFMCVRSYFADILLDLCHLLVENGTLVSSSVTMLADQSSVFDNSSCIFHTERRCIFFLDKFAEFTIVLNCAIEVLLNHGIFVALEHSTVIELKCLEKLDAGMFDRFPCEIITSITKREHAKDSFCHFFVV